jgi:hypothetical protein
MTSSTTPSATDATGRTIQAGDTVGGTTSGRYQTTVTGPVVQFGKGKVKVRVTNRPSYGGLRDANGDDTWISTDRVFLVHPATERRFLGFRTPDDRVWTVAARTKGVLWETPMVAQRYEGPQLRSVYQGKLHPVWEDVPAAPVAERKAAAQARAQAFLEGAARIYDLPQDYELDPGRGDARQLLERLAGEAYTGAYPLTVPWALLMDESDLIEFLTDLAGVMREADRFATLSGRGQARRILNDLEKTCGTWRAIAEAHHAHATAPGPDAGTTA